jgi:hypothetical protein
LFTFPHPSPNKTSVWVNSPWMGWECIHKRGNDTAHAKMQGRVQHVESPSALAKMQSSWIAVWRKEITFLLKVVESKTVRRIQLSHIYMQIPKETTKLFYIVMFEFYSILESWWHAHKQEEDQEERLDFLWTGLNFLRLVYLWGSHLVVWSRQIPSRSITLKTVFSITWYIVSPR